MKHWKFIFVGSLFIFNSSWALAQDDDESFVGYDQIIKELSTPSVSASRPRTSDPFQNVIIHGGVSFISSHISLEGAEIGNVSGFHRGFEASMGIDLFSPYWAAEGAIRNFSTHKIENTEVQLKEFDLRIVYKGYISSHLRYRIGMGMASRYLDLKYNSPPSEITTSAQGPSNLTQKREFTTPSTIISLGLEAFVSKSLSIGAEAGYRSALIDETIDKSAFDAILKVDAHF